MRTRLVRGTIDVATLLAEAQQAHNGATVLFAGTVRDVNDGRSVTGMEYTAYEAMAESELTSIASETARRFDTDDVLIEHRLGALAIGDVSVAIVVAHRHRANAFDAARYAIEELKRRVPIWKLEHYVDGTREWVDPTRRAGASVGGGTP